MFFRSGEKAGLMGALPFAAFGGGCGIGGGKLYSRRLTPYGQAPLGLEGSSAFRRSGSKGSKGGGIALSGDEYEVSVTGFTFSTIWYDKYSADWLAALASPYPASPDFHLKVKRLTMICASLALLQIMFAVHPRESVSHDSQVASLPYSTAITDSQYFARHCVPSKYVRWCDSCSLATPIQGAE